MKDRWRQIDQLFHCALERERGERAAFLAEACAGDEGLREEVESLLASHEQAESFIESPAADLAADLLENQAALADERTVGHYTIVTLVGKGGMGEVYLAQDRKLGRRVALKLLPAQFTEDEDRLRRFQREARAASALNHPNIITIHEIGQAEGEHFIVTEFIEGLTLRQKMAEAKMELREALDVALQVASALGAAHASGIMHRDIKPENVMLRPDGLVKVLDFGLAKLAEMELAATDTQSPTVVEVETKTGLVMGTGSYMSPEQVRGLKLDARSDIFSLGVVLYEMIAGRKPFEGATLGDVIAAILKEEPTPLRQHSREAPAELEWMVRKALAKDREERYQRVRELEIDLKRLRQELELQAKLGDKAPAGLQYEAIATRRDGQASDDSAHEGTTIISETEVTGADSGAEGPASRIKKRSLVSRLRMAVVVVALIIISSLASFYAGLKLSPSPPTIRQLTFRRGTVTTARFAPDGQTVVYSAAFGGRPIELFTLRLENSVSGSLKLQGGVQSISSTGEMAILLDCLLDWGECHEGTLASVPLVGGTPREIADNVNEADWGPDGKSLAIVHVVEGEYQLEYPKGEVLYRKPTPGWIGNIRVSPKGDMVAFIDHPILGEVGGSVMIVDRAGQTKVLSSGWKAVRRLAWSPAGDEVWFSASMTRGVDLHAVTLSGRERSFQSGVGLYLCDISQDGRVLARRGTGDGGSHMIGGLVGSEKEQNLSWFDWSTSADISADGKILLFYEWGRAVGGTPFVFLRKLDGSNDPVNLGQGKAMSLSPDGKWALALREGPPHQLVLLPTGSGDQRLLPPGEIVEYHYACWFPDGKQILFTGIEKGRGPRSYVQNISDGQMRPITEESITALLVSPDGNRLVVHVPDGGPYGTYYLTALDGTKLALIPGLGLGDEPIRWSADGRALYTRGSGDFDTNIYRIDLSTGTRKLWKEIEPDPVGLLGVEVKPGGILITPDGKSYVYTYWTFLDTLVLVEGLR